MLNNLTNFFNLIVGRRIKTQLEPSDLIAVGTKQSPALGDYKPTAIKFEDLQLQVARPYKSYTVSLVQANIDPPVVQVEFENSLNVQATYIYGAAGDYYVTFDQSLFNSPDDYVTISQGYYGDNLAVFDSFVYARPIFFNTVQINSINSGAGGDNILGQIIGSACILEVRVYNQ
jgi:hypothetical protein